MLKNICLIIILSIFINICFLSNVSFAQLADSPWPMRGQNPQHTGRGTSIYSASNTVKWKYQTGSKINSSPAIGTDGTLYIGSEDKCLHAINSDGSLKWKYETGNAIDSSPAIGSDSVIYVGSWDFYLYAIKPDGTLKWKYLTGNYVNSSPAIGSDSVIYVGSWDKYLYAINCDGTLKWKYQTGGSISSSPAIGFDETIYVGSWDTYLYAIKFDGTLKWKYQTIAQIDSSPAIGPDGLIYIGSGDKSFYSIKSDGTLKWKYYWDGIVIGGGIAPQFFSPSIGTDSIIYTGIPNNFNAIQHDGTVKCNFQIGKYSSSPSIGTDGTIYIGSLDGYIYAFSSEPYSVSLISPNGGDTFTVGSIRNIKWSSSGVSNAKIEYSINGGISWMIITETAQYGSYDWAVPNTLSTNCLIKISDAFNSEIYDICENPFSIIKPSLLITHPVGGEKIAAGSNIDIKWTNTSDNSVKIEYSTNNGSSWNIIVESNAKKSSADVILSPLSGGFVFIDSVPSRPFFAIYRWVVPEINSQKCLIRLTDSVFPDVSDMTDSVFTIIQPSLRVTYPNGGDRLAVGKNTNITWSSSYDCNVKLEYSSNSGISWTTIADSIASTGAFNWIVPNNISPNYLMKITDILNDTIYDISDSPFSVAQSSINVTYPNGGETLIAGQNTNITWTGTTDNAVKIEFTSDEGISWTTIIASNPATGQYNWTVPNINSEKCYLKISDIVSSNVFDISNAAFTIKKFAPPSNFVASDLPDDNGHSIQLTWTASPDVEWTDGYRIYRSRKPEFTEPVYSLFNMSSVEELIEKEQTNAILVATVAGSVTSYTDNFVPLNGVEYYYWIQSISDLLVSMKVPSGKITLVAEDTPTSYSVSTPYPNPFNPSTTISFSVPNSGHVSLDVYSLAGQKVATLVNGIIETGRHEVTFDGSGLASGVYLYRFESSGFSKTGKMLLMK